MESGEPIVSNTANTKRMTKKRKIQMMEARRSYDFCVGVVPLLLRLVKTLVGDSVAEGQQTQPASEGEKKKRKSCIDSSVHAGTYSSGQIKVTVFILCRAV